MRYLTIAQACDALQVDRVKIRNLINEGQFEAIKLGDAPNSHVRIDEESFKAYLERAKVQPAEPQTAAG